MKDRTLENIMIKGILRYKKITAVKQEVKLSPQQEVQASACVSVWYEHLHKYN
jgi:hypothetical protein